MKTQKFQPNIGIRLPSGWTSSDKGLPDMSCPDPEELKDGYVGVLWTAHRGDQTLEVRWMGNHAKYFCRVFMTPEDRENPAESRTFAYPHEVLDWLAMWFQTMGPFQAQPE